MTTRCVPWSFIVLFGLLACRPAVRPAASPATMPPTPQANVEAVIYLLAAKKAERQGERVEAMIMWEAAVRADGTSPTLRLGLARVLLAISRDSAAHENAVASILLDSTFSAGHQFLAEYYRHKGDLNRSAAHLEAVLRHEHDEEVGWKLAHLYNTLGRREESHRVLETLADSPKSTPHDLLQWAHVAENIGMKSSAEMFYRVLLRRWPESEEGVLAYGGYLDKLNRTAEAEALYRRRLQVRPSSEQVRQKLAWLLLGQERWLEADSIVSGVTPRAEDLDERKAWVSLLLKRGQFDLAIRSLDSLLARFPDDAEGYVLLGQAFSGRGDYRQATLAFSQAAARDSSVQALTGLIYAQVHAEDVAGAERSARAAVRTFPGDTRLKYMLGVTLRAQERWADAVEVFGELTRADSTNVEYLFYWGSSLERSGRFEEAATVFDRLLKRDPRNAAAQNYLGYMYAERRVNLDEALRLITQALAQEPENAAYLDSMGWVLYRLGRHDEARRYLLEAVKFDRANATIYEHLGDVCEALGAHNQAREHWQQALSLEPGNAQIQAKLNRLSRE